MRGRARRFHAVKTEWGFPNFISKQSLIDPSNGFIVDDKCIIGAEVFVIKSQGVIERLSLLKVGLPYERTWNIPDFSQSAIELVSERFLVGDYYWQIMLYPRGVEDAVDRSISIFVYLVDSVLLPLRKVKASITVKIEDQINGEHSIGSGSNWFASCDEYYGFSEFMSISDMHDPMRGYLVEDCCILKVEISVQAVAHNLNT
ncbi:hypothetical protein ACJIZ3_021452 [Penstemon smallii]|uniref:MATH domain-containing protein n=1 Tax=Penstemon smallii TaxID=265156 RepID=A0ABD3SM69_9LAMI